MNDPDVVSLSYRLVAEPVFTFQFQDPPRLERSTSAFDLALENDMLTVTLHGHFADEAQARSGVQPYLRAWEIKHTLSMGRREFSLQFQDSEIVDRDPPPPQRSDAGTVHLSAGSIRGRAKVSPELDRDRRQALVPGAAERLRRFGVT